MLPFVAPPGRALVVLSGRAGAQQRWKSPCHVWWREVEFGSRRIDKPSNETQLKFLLEGSTSLVAAGALEYVLTSQITVIFPGSGFEQGSVNLAREEPIFPRHRLVCLVGPIGKELPKAASTSEKAVLSLGLVGAGGLRALPSCTSSTKGTGMFLCWGGLCCIQEVLRILTSCAAQCTALAGMRAGVKVKPLMLYLKEMDWLSDCCSHFLS